MGGSAQRDVTADVFRSDTGTQFTDGQTLTLSVQGISHGLRSTVAVEILDGTVVLPSDWTSLPNRSSAPDTFSIRVTVTAHTAGGADAGLITLGIGGTFLHVGVSMDGTVDCDADNDGVANGADVCPNTVLPDPAPPSPKKNHYRANASGDFVDVKTGAVSAIDLADTGGCSAGQIVAAAGLGGGHTRTGLSVDALNAWVASH